MAPGLLRHRARLPDLRVTTDDVATTRWQRCTRCAGALDALQLRVWPDDRHVVGVVLCPGCQRRGDVAIQEAIHAMMDARYDAGRFGNNENGDADGLADPV